MDRERPSSLGLWTFSENVKIFFILGMSDYFLTVTQWLLSYVFIDFQGLQYSVLQISHKSGQAIKNDQNNK